MNLKYTRATLARRGLGVAALIGLAFTCIQTHAQLPPDFPQVSLWPNTNPAPGYLMGTLSVSNVPGLWSNWFAILDNNTNAILLNKTNSLGTLACNGLFVTKQGADGQPVVFILKDSSFNMIYTNRAGNGYNADDHDCQVLPNGHALILSSESQYLDLSTLVPGGFPAARVDQTVIQEVDLDNNVVFQWRSLDHIPITDTYQNQANPGDYIHGNSIWFDETDGNLILSARNTSEAIKISRVTGEVIWRMQGKQNQFTFTNQIPGNTDPAWFQVQHSVRRQANGHLTVFDNGFSDDSDPPFTRPFSRGVEYVIDETGKTAKLVWQFRHSPDIITYGGGSVERLSGGHSIIQWGTDNTASPALAMTEVDGNGNLVCDLALPQFGVTGNFTRVLWPIEGRYITVTKRELVPGNTYSFEVDTNVTGVMLEVGSMEPPPPVYNSVTVSRQPFAPVMPRFLSKAPRVLPVRVQISQGAIDSLTGVLSFDVSSFGFANPDSLTVYYRETPGEGLFVPLPTQYNSTAHQLQAEMVGFGEFVFGFPDLAEVPYSPLLIAPKPNEQVNQTAPVSFFWTPRGFVASYHLQVSTNADFSTLVLDASDLSECRYNLPAVLPNAQYYWRVSTSNDGGTSDWATNTFTTVPPAVQLTVPNGGELWQRGQSCWIQWNANLGGTVALDLYKAGAYVRNITTNVAAAHAYRWLVDLALTPGSDYAIKVSSTTNSALADLSDANFSIVDAVAVTVASVPAGLTIAVDGTNYPSPASFDWLSGSSHTLEALSPQAGVDGHSRSVFASWSDGGAQTNLITVPFWPTNYTATFSTQYLLDTTVNPLGAGTISNYPAGPWYDAGQLVSLSARTNTGYRISYWQGVDSANGDSAQATMSGYRVAQANFIPFNYPYVVVTNRPGMAPGQLIGNIGGRTADGTRTTYVILDNTGTNALFSSTTNTLHRYVTPQGFDAVAGSGRFQLKDETLNVVDSVTTLGPTLDTHDIELWPNGHTLLFGQEFRTVDMSQEVPGGKPNANVTGNVIQELDANKRVVFEWHTFDHIAITNTFADMTQASFDYAHINCVTIDPTDNNLLASLRTTSEIIKINRRNGQVMWRLGGKMNQFTFIAEHPENAPFYTVGQHDVHRLANGNLLYFDNGNISGGGITPSDRTYSRAVEYAIDEVAMTATLVWEFRHTPDISAPCTGSLKRMPNGNTFIDWGCAVPTSGYIVTEVNPAREVVFEMKHRQTGGLSSVMLGGGLTKQFWNDPVLVRSTTFPGIAAGHTYDSSDAGASVTVNNLSGPPESALVVQRHLDAVRFPQIAGKAPQVLMQHVVLASSNIVTLEAQVDLAIPDNSYIYDTPMIHDPAQLVVYHRPSPGQGQFSALPTTYDPGTQTLRVTNASLGEFIFGYPDVAETPFVPAIASPPDGTEVNQAAPIPLAWIPQGLVASFDLQVATNAGFTNLVLDTNGLGTTSFALQNPLPNTQYFWRVRAVNQGGTSDWASASFTTVPPVLRITYPAGGETWQRFQVVTIRWVDNLAENVALDIFKGGVSNRTFVASTPSSGSYTWTVGQFSPFPPGSDYTIRIRSTSNPALYAFSEPFSLITNLTSVTINVGSVTNLPDGRFQFGISIPGAVGATVLGSTNLVDWSALRTLPLNSSGAAVFTDDDSTNLPARFYRLSVP